MITGQGLKRRKAVNSQLHVGHITGRMMIERNKKRCPLTTESVCAAQNSSVRCDGCRRMPAL